MTTPTRKPNRIEGYDYSQNGAYFITMCTQNRKRVLCEIVGDDAHIVPKPYGQIVEKYIRNVGLDDEKCKLLIIKYLENAVEAKQVEIFAAVEDVLPGRMRPEQKRRKLSNLLQIMKTKDQIIDSRGKTSNTVWFLRK